jgi:hypothetical protein
MLWCQEWQLVQKEKQRLLSTALLKMVRDIVLEERRKMEAWKQVRSNGLCWSSRHGMVSA